jgi:hypothetical protein
MKSISPALSTMFEIDKSPFKDFKSILQLLFEWFFLFKRLKWDDNSCILWSIYYINPYWLIINNTYILLFYDLHIFNMDNLTDKKNFDIVVNQLQKLIEQYCSWDICETLNWEEKLEPYGDFTTDCIQTIEKEWNWVITIDTNMRHSNRSRSFLHWSDALVPIINWIHYSLLEQWETIEGIKHIRFNRKMESQLEIICSFEPIEDVDNQHNLCFEWNLITSNENTVHIKCYQNWWSISRKRVERHSAYNDCRLDLSWDGTGRINVDNRLLDENIPTGFLDILSKVITSEEVLWKLVNKIWLKQKVDEFRSEWVIEVNKLIWSYEDVVFPQSFKDLDQCNVSVNEINTKEINSGYLTWYDISFTSEKTSETYWWKVCLIIEKVYQ